MRKTENFKEAEKWGMDHKMSAKQTATMMGNIEDESTGITSQHGDKNYMQYEHGNGLYGKNLYDYIGKFEKKMEKMGEYVRDFKHASLGADESFFHNKVEVGKYGERRAELTHEMLPQVEKDYKAKAKKERKEHQEERVEKREKKEAKREKAAKKREAKTHVKKSTTDHVKQTGVVDDSHDVQSSSVNDVKASSAASQANDSNAAVSANSAYQTYVLPSSNGTSLNSVATDSASPINNSQETTFTLNSNGQLVPNETVAEAMQNPTGNSINSNAINQSTVANAMKNPTQPLTSGNDSTNRSNNIENESIINNVEPATSKPTPNSVDVTSDHYTGPVEKSFTTSASINQGGKDNAVISDQTDANGNRTVNVSGGTASNNVVKDANELSQFSNLNNSDTMNNRGRSMTTTLEKFQTDVNSLLQQAQQTLTQQKNPQANQVANDEFEK